jgi:large subunit ribosomal protein L10
MAISKDKKKVILEGLRTVIKDASTIVFVNFKGLKVNDAVKLRKDLKKQGVGYTVAKKTLMGIALGEQKVEGVQPELAGEVAIAYSKDQIAPAREIYEFAKKNKGVMTIIGGVFDGKFVDANKMISIASIPSMQTLRAQFVNLINSPIQGFVMAASEIAKKQQQ